MARRRDFEKARRNEKVRNQGRVHFADDGWAYEGRDPTTESPISPRKTVVGPSAVMTIRAVLRIEFRGKPLKFHRGERSGRKKFNRIEYIGWNLSDNARDYLVSPISGWAQNTFWAKHNAFCDRFFSAGRFHTIRVENGTLTAVADFSGVFAA